MSTVLARMFIQVVLLGGSRERDLKIPRLNLNFSKKKKKGVNLTPYNEWKLTRICEPSYLTTINVQSAL